ncbi:MAG: hypothetical protein HQK56_10035, partial [Deltaproteobacteria bacterium]|nr:hypothetical protein [Deltaproteobacteria bacterium]
MIDIESLKHASPIDQVANALGLKLKRTGSFSLSGNCPSGHASDGGICFTLDLRNHVYHCFSCKAAGDAIELVRFVQGNTFKEAITWLAETFAPHLLNDQSRGYHRQSRQSGNAENHGQSGIPEFEKMTKPPDAWLTWAADLQARSAETLFVESAEPYRRYLENRGIIQESAVRFGLGCLFNNEFYARQDIGLEDTGKKLCV